jgi:hypothetical protein
MRRSFVALAAAVLALAASACGGSGTSSSSLMAVDVSTSASPAAEAVLHAGQKTSASESGRVSFTATFTGTTSGTMSGAGVFAKRQGRFTLDASGLAGSGSVLPGGKVEVVFDQLVFYAKLPPDSGLPLPPGKEWLKVDLQKLAQIQGLNLEQLTQLSQGDPSQALDFLQGASDDFHEVGSEDVRGEPTTHYAGTVDLTRVAAEAPPDVAAQYRKLLQASPTKTLPMDVWIGQDGLVHRLSFEQTLPDNSSMTVDEQLYDFGVNADVSPPPADQVVDLTDFLGQS